MSSVATESLDFAINLFKQLSSDENLVFSPFSLSTCLSMVLMGTRSTCAQELSKVLFSKSVEDKDQESVAKQLKESIDKCIELNSSALKSANFMYIQTKFEVLPEFQHLIENYFSAKTKELDFLKQKKESIDLINADISCATNGKINKLLEDLDNSTVMVLANALYFKGLWSNQFSKDSTFTDKFTTNTKQQKDVQMMYKSAKYPFGYSQHLKAKAIELSYENINAVMIVLLPDEDIPLKQMITNLNIQSLNQLVSGLNEIKVDLYLPKFKLESTLQLIPTLKKLGINGIFDHKSADFSGLSRKPNGLYVSQVIQKAMIEVSEEGTEAAAATAVAVSFCCAMRNQEFKANRPFVYCLVTKNDQRQIDSILFMGECNNPNL